MQGNLLSIVRSNTKYNTYIGYIIITDVKSRKIRQLNPANKCGATRGGSD